MKMGYKMKDVTALALQVVSYYDKRFTEMLLRKPCIRNKVIEPTA